MTMPIDRVKLRALAIAANPSARRVTRLAERNYRWATNPDTILALLDMLNARDATPIIGRREISPATDLHAAIMALRGAAQNYPTRAHCNAYSDGFFDARHAAAELAAASDDKSAPGQAVPEGWRFSIQEDGCIFFGRPDGMRATVIPGELIGSHGDTLYMLMRDMLAATSPATGEQA